MRRQTSAGTSDSDIPEEPPNRGVPCHPSRANLVCRGLVACGDEDVSGGVSEGVGRGVGVAGDGDGVCDLGDVAERAHDLLDAHAGLVLEAPGDGQRREDDGQVGLDRVFGVVEDRLCRPPGYADLWGERAGQGAGEAGKVGIVIGGAMLGVPYPRRRPWPMWMSIVRT